MAKTYKIKAYLVDANGDDSNIYDIGKIINDNTDLFGKLEVKVSPTWQWTDDCQENYGTCTNAEYEERFEKHTPLDYTSLR